MSTITVIGGLPGVGKTMFGKELASRSGAALVDRDTLMGPIVDAALMAAGRPAGDHSSPVYWDLLCRPAYRAAEDTALEIAATSGLDVVLVGCYTVQASEGDDWWGDLTGRFAASGVDARLLWLTLDRTTHLRRMSGRGAERDQARLAGFDRWWVAQNKVVPTYAIPVRASLPAKVLVDLIGAKPLAGQLMAANAQSRPPRAPAADDATRGASVSSPRSIVGS